MTLAIRVCGIVSPAMKSFVIFLLFACSLLVRAADPPAAVTKAEDPRQLLQQGLFEEEANRDFEKAADAYARLLKEYDRQRALAATALFRLAEIRAKQGNKTEAIALHQRLLAEFPNHDPLAKLSRERLATLGGAAPPTADVAEAPTESEATELARVREMVKNSPDLVNAVHVAPAGPKETPLAFAVKNGWLQVGTFLLDHGAAVNGVPDSVAPLNVAAREGHKAIVELLLARGAKINPSEIKGDSALMVACANRRAEVVQLLLDRGADPNYANDAGVTALHAACVAKNAEIARMLIEKGAQPNTIARAGAKISGEAADGTPLYYAVAAQQPELVGLLLDHRADANIPRPGAGTTPLILAVGRSDESIVTLLLTHGAKPDLADENGNTALHYAAQIRAPQLVRLLLDHGASPNLANKEGATPCHTSLAASGGAFSDEISPRPRGFGGRNRADEGSIPAKDVAALKAIWEALAGKGADFNARNQIGSTPLHYGIALQEIPAEAALWLIEHGADPQIKDQSGHTPLDLATGERRLFFEKRLIFPKLAKERAVSAFVRTGSEGPVDTPGRIESVAEFEKAPSLLELLREKGVLPTLADEFAELVVYRGGDADTIKEVARAGLGFDERSNTLRYGTESDPAKWPELRWGDVVVFERGKRAQVAPQVPRPVHYVGNAIDASDVLPHKLVMVTLQLGERSGALKMGDMLLALAPRDGAFPSHPLPLLRPRHSASDSQPVWSVSEPLPLWRFSEFVERVIAAEPRAQIGAVKVQRTVDGKVREWVVDMRAGDGVKELPARIGDGDTIIIPLRSASAPEALSKRRTGIFQTAPGRVLGQQVFQRKSEDGATRTLGEFLMQSYLTGEMIVPLPDFAKIVIYRLKGESGEEEKLTIDFTKAIAAATDKSPAKDARALDVPLQWGDIIEIQQALGSTEQWRGFTPQTVLYLKKALTRVVDVWINGAKKGELSLEPEIPNFLQAGSERQVPAGRFSPFAVSEIARRANVQLEELVKVTIRSGENVREFTPEQLRAIDPWVQHGDRIEIERL